MRAKIDHFPAKNPNPILCVAKDMTVLYSNDAGEPILREWGVKVGDKLPSDISDFVQRVVSRKSPEKMEVREGEKVYQVTFYPSPEEEYVNIYGFDISDQKELEEKLRIKEKQNDVLYKIGKIALENESLQTFMDKSVKLIANILDLEYCKIMELLPDGRFLLRAGVGWKPGFVGKQIVRGERESQAGYTLLTRMPVIVEDFSEENRFNKPEILGIHSIASGASAIIGSMESVFGVLIVNSTKKRKFTSDDTYFLTSVAFLIAQVVERKKAEEALKKACDSLEEKVKERTSELEKAYESLKESEKSLSKAQRIAHIGNWNWNILTGEVRCSDELYRIFGLSPQEFGMTYSEALNYVHPEDREYINNAAKKALEGSPSGIDHRIISSDGRERIVHSQGEVIFDEKNIPIRIIGTVQDITERKKAEEKIQSLANIVESSNDAIGTMSLDGIIISWNKGAEQIYGYSAEEILGKPSSVLDPSFSGQEIKELIEMIKKWKEIRQYDTSRLRKDGTIIDVSLNFSPVFDTSGKLAAVSVIARDITESKRAEEKLRENEEKYRNIVETANEGIVIIDNEFTATYVNKKIADMVGYSQEECIIRPIWDFISEESRSIVESNLKKRRQVINESYEFKLIRKDGSPLWVFSNSKSLFDKDGKYIGSLSMLTDITKRKEAEEALANIEIARKKEIHHRIKNNLQVITSLLDLQADKFKNRKNIKDSEVLEAFMESKDRVISMALIHEELHKGGGLETLNFSSYIEELAENLFLTYRLGDTSVNLNMDLEENLFLDMDTAVPLGIIVNELVSNSFKHAFPGRDKGEIRIKLHREGNGEPVKNRGYVNGIEECKNQSFEDTRFVLEVSDNGVGIPEDLEIECLDSLGLLLVNSLIEQLDGELQLKRNDGTKFTIRFAVATKTKKVSVPALRQLIE